MTEKLSTIETETLLTIKDVCERTQLGQTFVRAAIRVGDLPVHKMGKAVRIKPHDLNEWIARQAA